MASWSLPDVPSAATHEESVRITKRGSLARKFTPLGVCAASLTGQLPPVGEVAGEADESAGAVQEAVPVAFARRSSRSCAQPISFAGSAGLAGRAGRQRGAAAGPRPRIITLSSADLSWDDWALEGELAGFAFTSTSSAGGRSRTCSGSVRSALSALSARSTGTPSSMRPFSLTPSSPSRLSTSRPQTGSKCPPVEEPRRLYGGPKPWRTACFVPGWTLRYCELVGHTPAGPRLPDKEAEPGPAKAEEPAAQPKAEKEKAALKAEKAEKAVAPAARSAAEPNPGSAAKQRRQGTAARMSQFFQDEDSGGEGESAFLCSRHYDKRVIRLLEKDNRPARPSRYVARRSAVCNEVGHTKMQVGLAIRILKRRRPEHMRRLMRRCEPRASKLQTLRTNSKDLSTEQLVVLTGRKGLSDQEVRDLFSVFNHYDFDESGFLDHNEVRNVLEDLGLQPRTREEKVEVNEILCDQDLDGLRQYSFNEFLTMVKAIRTRLRQIQQAECMHVFDFADRDGSHSLDFEEVTALLESHLDLHPRNEDERHDVKTIFSQCDTNGDGMVQFEEFQIFVQRVRVKLLMTRREEERTIAKAFHLDAAMVAEFRSEIPLMWDVFTRFTGSGRQTIQKADLPVFFLEIGVTPRDQESKHAQIIDTIIDAHSRRENDFPWVLDMVRIARRSLMSFVQDELKKKFQAFDRDGDGCLSMPEVYHVLEDFRMLPRNRDEQREIATVINTLDRDGSGTFDFEEFQDLIQRMTEQVRYSEREREHKVSLDLCFTDEQHVALRRVFMQLGPDEVGKVARHQLMSSVVLIRSQIDLGLLDDTRFLNYFRTVQLSPDRGMDFIEFLRSVRGAAAAAAVEEPNPGDKQANGDMRRNTSGN